MEFRYRLRLRGRVLIKRFAQVAVLPELRLARPIDLRMGKPRQSTDCYDYQENLAA
jgi:hypothetical protein